MTHRDRWLDEESEALGQSLLSAGKAERPPEAALARTLTALGASAATMAVATELGAATAASSVAGGAGAGGAAGITGAGITGAGITGAGVSGVGISGVGVGTQLTGTVAAKSVTGVLIAKWVSGGVVVGVTAFGAAELVDDGPSVTAPIVQATPVADEAGDIVPVPRAVPRTQEEVTRQLVEEAPSEADIDAPREPLVRRSLERRLPSEAKQMTTAEAHQEADSEIPAQDDAPLPDLPSELRAELGLIDEARALLEAGNAGASLQKLSAYRERFARGRLLPEALFLEMQAHDRLGRRAQAERAARAIIERYPSGPHAGRAREILQR